MTLGPDSGQTSGAGKTNFGFKPLELIPRSWPSLPTQNDPRISPNSDLTVSRWNLQLKSMFEDGEAVLEGRKEMVIARDSM